MARIGGEEFVIVDFAEPGSHPDRDFDRVRRAIAAPTDYAITASVGVVSVAVASFAAPKVDPVVLLDTLIERADHSMFSVKRDGGNATAQLHA